MELLARLKRDGAQASFFWLLRGGRGQQSHSATVNQLATTRPLELSIFVGQKKH